MLLEEEKLFLLEWLFCLLPANQASKQKSGPKSISPKVENHPIILVLWPSVCESLICAVNFREALSSPNRTNDVAGRCQKGDDQLN